MFNADIGNKKPYEVLVGKHEERGLGLEGKITVLSHIVRVTIDEVWIGE
jgi:hypothetical protein